jgi:hypothetical protein
MRIDYPKLPVMAVLTNKTFYMSRLVFKNFQLRKVLAYYKGATTFNCTFAEQIAAYEKDTGMTFRFDGPPMPEMYLTSNKRTIFLVKDTGIYLMTSVPLKEIPKDESHICYAVNYSPANPNCWEDCRTAVGGDDFSEAFELTDAMIACVEKGADIIISFRSDSFLIKAQYPKNKVSR